MNQKELETNLQSLSKSDLHVILHYVRLRHIRHQLLKLLYRVDLWLFPPLAFLSTFLATSKYFPSHQIKLFAVLSTAFMFSTLTLFLLRPRKWKWKRIAHWVKAQQ